VTEERLRFVARLLDGEGMSEVCRDFGISRKTDYKIFSRYKDQGLDALTDRSRRPVRYANQLPDQVERLIVDSSATSRIGARAMPNGYCRCRSSSGTRLSPGSSWADCGLDHRGAKSASQIGIAGRDEVGISRRTRAPPVPNLASAGNGARRGALRRTSPSGPTCCAERSDRP